MISKQIEGIDHVAIQVSSLAEGLRFFRDLLGLKMKFDITYDGVRVVVMQAGKIQVELWENIAAGSLPEPEKALERPGFNHLAFAVKDLAAVLAGLKANGYPVVKDVYEPTRGIKEAVVLGPDNIEVQFTEQNVPLLIWRSLKGDFRLTGEMPAGREGKKV